MARRNYYISSDIAEPELAFNQAKYSTIHAGNQPGVSPLNTFYRMVAKNSGIVAAKTYVSARRAPALVGREAAIGWAMEYMHNESYLKDFTIIMVKQDTCFGVPFKKIKKNSYSETEVVGWVFFGSFEDA